MLPDDVKKMKDYCFKMMREYKMYSKVVLVGGKCGKFLTYIEGCDNTYYSIYNICWRISFMAKKSIFYNHEILKNNTLTL